MVFQSAMPTITQAVFVAALSLLGGVLFAVSPIDPVRVQLPALRTLPNTSVPPLDFAAAKHVGEGHLVGPESLAVSEDGATLFAGLGYAFHRHAQRPML